MKMFTEFVSEMNEQRLGKPSALSYQEIRETCGNYYHSHTVLWVWFQTNAVSHSSSLHTYYYCALAIEIDLWLLSHFWYWSFIFKVKETIFFEIVCPIKLQNRRGSSIQGIPNYFLANRIYPCVRIDTADAENPDYPDEHTLLCPAGWTFSNATLHCYMVSEVCDN